MTLKQRRQLAAQNGHTGREPNDLTPRLPDDFPNESKRNPQNSAPQYPKTADKRLARRIVRMLESATVVQEIDRFHRNHPGQKSRISTKALLLGMVLAAYETGRYLRSDICSYLNGLDYRLGVELGLWTWDTRHPVTYTMTQKQIKRLETAIFQARYSSNGQPRSIDCTANRSENLSRETPPQGTPAGTVTRVGTGRPARTNSVNRGPGLPG